VALTEPREVRAHDASHDLLRIALDRHVAFLRGLHRAGVVLAGLERRADRGTFADHPRRTHARARAAEAGAMTETADRTEADAVGESISAGAGAREAEPVVAERVCIVVADHVALRVDGILADRFVERAVHVD